MDGRRAFRFDVFTKNKTNPAYAGARLGIDRMAARLGIAVRHHAPEQPDSVEEQRALIEAALADPPDAIALIPAHPTTLNPTIRRIQAAGITLVGFVNRPEGVDLTTFVGADDHALAFAIAERLFSHLGGRGSVAILQGHPDAPSAEARTGGFLESAARHPGIRIVASGRGFLQHEPARAATEALLRRHGRIDGLLAANDLMAMGAIEAMQAAGQSFPIVAVNASPDGIAAIKAGTLLASAAFDAMKMGCVAVEAAYRALHGQTVPRELLLPVETVDASNCAAWDLPYAERELPDWDATLERAASRRLE